jgi:hypothetical protein
MTGNLKKPVSPIDVYKATPKTNCKACGFSTCLAFATQVISGETPLEVCPYIPEEAARELRTRIAAQKEAGVSARRDVYKDTSEFVRARLDGVDFRLVADGIGASYLVRDGEELLRLVYLNRECLISKKEILIDGAPARNHWDAILLYNYVYYSGNAPLEGEWIPIDVLPGHIPKKPELEHGCEEKIAACFQGNLEALKGSCRRLGGEPLDAESNAEAAFVFRPLPKVPFYLLFWDEDPEEGFPARAKVLFDRSVPGYLDIESLVFLAERFADALTEEG